jgi:membrane protein required for colicin V production
MISELSTFDVIIGALVLFFGIKGMLSGFIREIAGLLGIIGGTFIASRYATDVGLYINDNIYPLSTESAMLKIVGFTATFLGFWLIIIMVGKFIASIVIASGLGIINRILGFIAGGSKIFLMISIIIFVLSHIEITKSYVDNIGSSSKVYPLLQEAGAKIINLQANKNNNSDTNNTIINKGKEIINQVQSSLQESTQKLNELKNK